jgi:uncharacterized coiled-coil DUF342 family protein
MLYVVMLKLMKKKAKVEEDAKKYKGELGKANCELRDIRNELKIVQPKIKKVTAGLKSIGNYRHNVKLAHVCLLYLFFRRNGGIDAWW